VKYGVFGSVKGIKYVSHNICRDDRSEFVKVTESITDDSFITIRQTFIIPKNGTHVFIHMEISNCSKKVGFDDFLVK
jgi:alkyl hydroperoxide reductase subunit AhpC